MSNTEKMERPNAVELSQNGPNGLMSRLGDNTESTE